MTDDPRSGRCQRIEWRDSRGALLEINLSRFIEGRVSGKKSSRMTFRGRPQLTGQVKVALEQKIHDLSLGSVRNKLKALAHFYAFLDKYERGELVEGRNSERSSVDQLSAESVDEAAPRIFIEALSDLPQDIWLAFGVHLRGLGRKSRSPLVALVSAQEMIEEARRIYGLPPLQTYRLSRFRSEKAKLQNDIDYEALRYLHRVAICEMRRSNSTLLGTYFMCPSRKFDESASIPDKWGDTMEGCRQFVYAFICQRLRGGGNLSTKDLGRFASSSCWAKKRVRSTGIPTQNLSDYLDWFVPDFAEVLAGFIIVASRTGWIDSAYSIDLSKPWSQELQSESNGHSSEKRYSLRSIRPKTGGFVVHLSTNGPYSAYKVIERLKERTKLLRRVAAESAREIRSRSPNPSAEEMREIDRLESVAISPFAYMSRGPNPTPRRLFEGGMVDYRDCLSKLISRAAPAQISGLSHESYTELKLRAANVRLSDLRDAHLERVWRKTGSLHAVQLSAGHRQTQTTLIYLNRRKIRIEHFRRYAALMGIITDEIITQEVLDPAVVFLRVRVGQDLQISEQVRRELSRSRIGIHCANPFDPPPVYEGGVARNRCGLDLCVMCKNGLIFINQPGVFEALAVRYRSLKRRISRMPLEAVSGSLEEFEVCMIDLVVCEYYFDRREEFFVLSSEGRGIGLGSIDE